MSSNVILVTNDFYRQFESVLSQDQESRISGNEVVDPNTGLTQSQALVVMGGSGNSTNGMPKRGIEITNVDVSNLFAIDEAFNPETTLILVTGLRQGLINPDVALLQCLKRGAKLNKDQMYLIGLCLRYKANTNMYVNIKTIGDIHLLGYAIVTSLQAGVPISIVNGILAMLLASNSNWLLPAFDSSGGKIKEGNLFSVQETMTISEWLQRNGYMTILQRIDANLSQSLRNALGEEGYRRLAIILDRDDMIDWDGSHNIGSLSSSSAFPYMKLSQSEQRLVMQCHCESMVLNSKLSIEVKLNGFNSANMSLAIGYYNLIAFRAIIDKGDVPVYATINVLLMKMKASYTIRPLVYKVLETMLLLSIERGVPIDAQQAAFIGTINPVVTTKVNNAYAQPFWKKVCQNPDGVVTNNLKILALSLGLNANADKSMICGNLAEFQAIGDPEKLNQAITRRQQMKMAASVGTVRDFIDPGNDITTSFKCNNQATLTAPFSDINEVDIEFYQDKRGDIWCLTSDMYEDLLDRKINPYTTEAVPDTFLDKVKLKHDLLKKLGLSGKREIMLYSKSLTNLQRPDVISDELSETMMNNLIRQGAIVGVPEAKIRSLTAQQINEILRVNSIMIDLTPLTNQHARYTLAYIVNLSMDRGNSGLANSIMKSITGYNANRIV